LAIAQTGTGKTAAFGFPMIQNADMSVKDVQGIILCPTRELCMQISKDLESFSKYTEGFRVVPVYGGAPIDKQIQKLKRGAQIVVGTPGRTRDLIERKVLKIKNIKWVVLDEADEMLQMGFKDELDAILEGTPAENQTLLYTSGNQRRCRKIHERWIQCRCTAR
jgi:ATP-dependent RNA helicase DeaD